MIQIHLATLLAILQVAIVLVALWLFYFLKARRLQRDRHGPQQVLAEKPVEPQAVAPAGPDPSEYLSAEAEASRARAGAQPGDNDQASAAASASAWLALRADLLQLESLLAKQTERDEVFWESLAGRMSALLASHGLHAATPVPPVAEDVQSSTESAPAFVAPASEELESVPSDEDDLGIKRLLSEGVETIGGIKTYINRVITDSEPKAEAMHTIDRLGRCYGELAQCVAVLEDENVFLRNQIAALHTLE